MIADARRPEYLSRQGQLVGRPQVSTMFKGRRFVAVGSRLGWLDPDITFHEFIMSLLLGELGHDWIVAQEATSADHPLIRWKAELADIRRQPALAVVGNTAIANLTGNAMALLSMAYDCYSILHCAALPKSLVSRLRHPDQFQGAKYEMSVAALFARAGFTIEWIDDPSQRRPEFHAIHKTTAERIAVEAKSRHRDGVLGGPASARHGLRLDLTRLFRESLKKATAGLPYAIFLDANLPIAPTDVAKPPAWADEMQRMIERRDKGLPAPYTSVFVTNFSWHYAGQTLPLGLASELVVS